MVGQQFAHVTDASRHLLEHGFSPPSVTRALEIVGRGAKVDRVYIFENVTDPATKQLLCSQRYEWSAGGVEPQLDNPLLQDLSYADVLPGWQARLARDEVIHGLVAGFPSPVRELLAEQDILSLLICPIMQDGQWWGFVGFDDCHSRRAWPEDEIAGLRLLARALAGALRHAAMRERFEKARQQLRSIVGK